MYALRMSDVNKEATYLLTYSTLSSVRALHARWPASMTPSRTVSVSQFSVQLIQTRNRPTFARKFSSEFQHHNS